MTKVKNTRRKRTKQPTKRSASKTTASTSVKSSAKAAPVAPATPQPHQQPRPIAYKALGSDKQDEPLQPPIKQTSSWDLVWPSARLWWNNRLASIVLFVAPSALLVIGVHLASKAGVNSTLAYASVGILALSYIWLIINIPAVYYVQVKAIHGETPGLWQCYRRGFRVMPRLIGLLILLQVAVIAGLVLLIVPGLILLRRYYLSPYYLVDQDLGIREAMRRSAADSKPVARSIWGVFGVYLAINIAGSLTIGQLLKPYGTLVTAVVSTLYVFASALRYKEVALRKSALDK